MTFLAARHATDGIAVISDRKETYLHGPPRDVKKYYLDRRGRFYVSLAGDGKLAEAVLKCLARSRTGPADVLARLRSIAKDFYARTSRKMPRADGFLVVVEGQGPKLYNIGIKGGRVNALEDRGGVSAHGDEHALTLCEYITKKAGLSGMRCEEAARHLHVLASDVAENVDSVGNRGEYGFDLVLFAAAGGAKLLERDMKRHGRIDVRFHMADMDTAHGGDAP